jgi:hypothetical protein
MQKNEIEPLSHTWTKIYLKWIKFTHVRPETIKLIEETQGKSSKYWSAQLLLG